MNLLNPATQLEDVYRFEQTLKESLLVVQKEKRKYQVILIALLAFNGIAISNLLWQYFQSEEIPLLSYITAIGGGCGIALFFTSGTYTDKIEYAQKYVSRCNVTLRIFNISFSAETGKLVLLSDTANNSNKSNSNSTGSTNALNDPNNNNSFFSGGGTSPESFTSQSIYRHHSPKIAHSASATTVPSKTSPSLRKHRRVSSQHIQNSDGSNSSNRQQHEH